MYTSNFVETGKNAVNESFRDTIATANPSGKRIWLYPKNPKGKFTRLRTVVAWLLIGWMISGPYMKIDGEPILLLNIIERKFIIFGKIFWPQDFQIFLLIMIAFVIFIGLFTVVYGRVFCGWVCPQTIFMESIFRKIEFWIEGDWKTRKALDKSPLSSRKFFKKIFKHALFFFISFVIACTFLSYIIGAEKVWDLVYRHPAEQIGTFSTLLVFTFVFYWVFARFREQVCTTICPYGRLQGVLLDKKSLVVAYDYVRGEMRGKLKKYETRSEVAKGDCIDCNQCVNVCPMGIDIRNGTQLECINCTACMDACDFMMKKVGLKQGLIRIDSEAAISEGKRFRVGFRMIGYTSVLLILLGFIFSMLIFRSDVETTMLRARGSLFQELPDNKVSNLYNIKMINKTSKEIDIKVKVLSGNGEISLVGKDIIVPPQGTAETAAFIILDKQDIKQVKTKLKIGVFSGDEKLETLSTTFLGPVN